MSTPVYPPTDPSGVDVTGLRAAVLAYGDARAATAVAPLRVELAQASAELARTQAEFAAYRASHPDEQPPEPEPTGCLFGSSVRGPLFKAEPGGLGYDTTAVSRIYLRNLPKGSTWSNIVGDATATADIRNGVERASDLLWLSVKESDPTLLDAFLSTMPKDLGLDVWGTFHHEPENDAPGYPAATFVKEFRATAPVFRKHGLLTASVLMRYTFQPASGRDWHDWWPGSAYVDVFGCDSYNTGNKKGVYSVPEDQFAPIAAAAAEVGKPWAIGEIGALIFDGKAAARAAWTAGVRQAALDGGALALAWWDQDGYAFDSPTARAWLGE